MKSSVKRTERALVRAILKAQRAGVAIICDGFEIRRRGKVVGVCALGAHNRFSMSSLALPAPSNAIDGAEDAFTAAYDAIEAGFDGADRDAINPNTERRYHRRWLLLGLRLRERFSPVSADSIRGGT